jgi:hypothetical protein
MDLSVILGLKLNPRLMNLKYRTLKLQFREPFTQPETGTEPALEPESELKSK